MSDDVGPGADRDRGIHVGIRGRGTAESALPAGALSSMWPAIGQVTGVTSYFIQGRSRLGGVVYARALAIRVMRERHGMSWPAIGRVLNRRQSTVYELDRVYGQVRALMKDTARVSEILDAQIAGESADRRISCPPAPGS